MVAVQSIYYCDDQMTNRKTDRELVRHYGLVIRSIIFVSPNREEEVLTIAGGVCDID